MLIFFNGREVWNTVIIKTGKLIQPLIRLDKEVILLRATNLKSLNFLSRSCDSSSLDKTSS